MITVINTNTDLISEKDLAWRVRLTISKQSRQLVDLSAKQVPAQGGRERLMSYLTTHTIIIAKW